MKAVWARLTLGFWLPAIAAVWTPAREAFPGEGLSLTCSLAKKTFLLGEPVIITCRLSGNFERLPREPWFCEGATFRMFIRDSQGGIPQGRKSPYSTWRMSGRRGPGWGEGIDVGRMKAVIFQRDVYAGSLFVPPPFVHAFSLEQRGSVEGRDWMVGFPYLGPGDYALTLTHRLRTRKAIELAGDEDLNASAEIQFVEAPEREKHTFGRITLRPPFAVGIGETALRGTQRDAEFVMGQYRDVYRTYPWSVYAIWGRYFHAKVLVDGKRWFEAAKVLDELPAADKEKRLPNYEVAYLRALCAEKTANAAKARKILADAVPEGVMVFLDCAETGEQREGWRLFRLQRNLGRAPGKERPGYGPRPPVPRALDGVFNETATGELRKRAVEALPDDLPPGSLAALRWLLRRQDESEHLRRALVEKLRRSGDEELASDVTEMLWDEVEAPRRRSACVGELGNLYRETRDAEVMGTLLDAAKAESEVVRRAAVGALTWIAAPADGSRKPDEDTVARIKKAALAAAEDEEADTSVRTAGISSCARLGVVEALPTIRVLAREDGAREQYRAIEALGELGSREDLPLLEHLAKHGGRLVRGPAKRALEKSRARLAEP